MNKIARIMVHILAGLWFAVKTLFLLYAVAFSIAGTVALCFAYQFVMAPLRQVAYLRDHNPTETAYIAQCRALLKPQDTLFQTFIPIDSISVNLRNAVLAAEDDGFYAHPGFDIEAMLSAMEYNRAHNSIKRGASTITQQLAKNLFLTNNKTFERKFKELGYTLLMEKYLGKKRILELYLNYAQWGKNIFGCEAASRRYYRKSSKNLSRYEAARLAAVLSMPNKATPLNAGPGFMGERIGVIANNLYLHRQIDDSGYMSLTGMPPPGKDSIGDDSSAIDEPASDSARTAGTAQRP